MGYDHDDKGLNLNDLDEQLFEKIFSHTFAALVDKLINTTNKEEKQILIKYTKTIKIKFTNKMIFVIL